MDVVEIEQLLLGGSVAVEFSEAWVAEACLPQRAVAGCGGAEIGGCKPLTEATDHALWLSLSVAQSVDCGSPAADADPTHGRLKIHGQLTSLTLP